MTLVGYARVSSAGQSLGVQLEQLMAAGCGKVFSEKRSGTTRDGREQLDLALGYVREGDVFVVTRLDRLARSLGDLSQIIRGLNAKGVGFRCLQQDVDTTRPEGRLLLHMLAAFAEFEADLRRDRQMEGIERAKAEGRYRGRPTSVDPAEVRRLAAEGMKPAHIARSLKIGRSSVYRALEEKPKPGEEPG